MRQPQWLSGPSLGLHCLLSLELTHSSSWLLAAYVFEMLSSAANDCFTPSRLAISSFLGGHEPASRRLQMQACVHCCWCGRYHLEGFGHQVCEMAILLTDFPKSDRFRIFYVYNV
eukprot:6214818-Pleurochrysis_carterae.AAC.9